MKAILPALLSMLGLSWNVPEPLAPEPSPVVDTGDPAGLAYLPRGGFPRRRAYVLPAGDWSTPNRPSLRGRDDPKHQARRNAKRLRDALRTVMGRDLSRQRAYARHREFVDRVDRDFVRLDNGWIMPVQPVPSSVRESQRWAAS